jgi:hypothetical protein
MKKLLKNIDWVFDYYIGYFLTNGNKINRYHKFMLQKWGDRYKKKNRTEDP